MFTSRIVTAFTTGVLACAAASCGGGSGTIHLGGGGSLSWQQVSVPSGATQISGFAVSSSDHWFIADRNKGFYRSIDQGGSWTPINSGISNTFGWTIDLNPANGDLIASTYAGASGTSPVRFYRSTNEGASWTAISAVSLSSAAALTGCAFPSNGNIVCGGFWASTPNSGAWVSTNSGQSTTNVSNSANMGGSVYSLAINPVGGDLWLGAEQMGIYRSTDNGLTWTQASPADTNCSPWQTVFGDGNISRNHLRPTEMSCLAGKAEYGSRQNIRRILLVRTFRRTTTTQPLAKAWDGTPAATFFYSHNPDPSDTTSAACSTDDGATWKACDSGIPAGLTGQDFIVSSADGKL